MQVIERSIGDFAERVIVDNKMLEDNCINCHTFLKNNPEKFLIHVRGSLNGTYFVNGKEVIRRSLRTGKMIANAVYPAWHPSGRYIAFSSNEIVEAIHMLKDKKIEVYDQSALLVNYDCEKDEISAVEESDTVKFMETFPCWSPDGAWLYYCRTKQIKSNFDYRNIRYDLVRRPFDISSGLFGKAEVVFNANETGKSVSLPNISPDGNYLIFVLHNYGTFSIWHKEADLYLLDLNNRKTIRMSLNSNDVESYHSWSSNGKWIVFSSKRGDGLTARPYLAYFGSPGNVGKPFVLPQKDPGLYSRLGKTFNRPEFLTGRIIAGPGDFEQASGKEPVKAVWTDRVK
jgi:Tol biopolymer transport system component